jgi:hypothetical protein
MDKTVLVAGVATLLAIGAGVWWLVRGTMAERAGVVDDEPAATGGSKLPKQSHHYAWAKDIDSRRAELAALGVSHAPKPVDASSPLPVPAGAPPTKGSAWNAAGTWESRDISHKAGTLLEEVLRGFARPVGGDGSGMTLRISSVTSRDGSASLAFVRGRVRPGYEFGRVRASWVLEGPEASSSLGAGSLELVELCDTESDLFSRLVVDVVSVSAPELDRPRVQELVRGLAGELRSALRAWAQQLAELPG